MNTPQLLYELIHAEAIKQPTALAIQAPGKKGLTYRDLYRHLQSTTLQLTRLGIRSNDRLAVVLPNGPEMATTFLAVSSVCTCAPLNPSYPQEEFRFNMEDFHVKALVALPSEDHPARLAAYDLGLPILALKPDLRTAGIFSLISSLPSDKTISEPVLANVEDVALELHTSGTTSRPKIVPISHHNIYSSVYSIANVCKLSPTDCCLNMMPLFHVHGLIGAVAASLISGARVICAPGFISDQVLSWLSELKPTWYTAVPTIHQAVKEQIDRQPDRIKFVNLRFIRSASSPLDPLLAQTLESVFNAPVIEAYGMTEATHQITSNPFPPQPHKYGSVGLANGTTQIAILDEQGKALPIKAVGEICIRGENVMSGYKNNPAANAASYIDGWLRTGDLGYLDEDGYLFIQGRLKEIINHGGEKISPYEIDEVLLQHPAVDQAFSFAIAHPTFGEDVAAVIVLKKDKTVTMQELRQFAAASLADFKVPRLIVFIPEIPKGATGKIQRIGLADKLKEELEAVRIQETSDKSNPRTPFEVKILSIWQEVLEQESIGIHDDFLALGGDSLMAARILMLVDEYYGVNFTLGDIFTAPTIALMADLVQERQNRISLS